MGKFEVQIEGCMSYITFWDNLSSNGLCRPTKALYEDFHLTSKGELCARNKSAYVLQIRVV